MNQGRTKDEPTNSQTQKSTFVKIAILFISLIPSLVLPTDDRENTERGAHQLPAHKKGCLLRLPPKKVDFFPKKVDSFPKSVALYSSPLHPTQKKSHQKAIFLAHLEKKVYLCGRNQFSN